MRENGQHEEERLEIVSIREVFESLRRQSSLILLSLAAMALLTSIGLITAYLFAPAERTASIHFRLLFQGAETGRYPNGSEFSTADVVVTPVIQNAYDENRLDRYVSFDSFSSSLYVVEENEALQRLTDQYRTKLADPKLTAVDRERMEREFEQKIKSIQRSMYALFYTSEIANTQIPRPLIEKFLREILKDWAEFSKNERGSVRHDVPVVSMNILPPGEGEPVLALDLLRSKVMDVIGNIQTLRAIPGADALRTEEGLTLMDVETELSDLIRLELLPALDELRLEGRLVNRQRAMRYLETRLEFVRRQRRRSAATEESLEQALRLYSGEYRGTDAAGDVQESRRAESVMPQIDDSFLERIVAMAAQGEDQEYRRSLVNQIAQASTQLIPYDLEISYYVELLDGLRAAPTGSVMSDDPAYEAIEGGRTRLATGIKHVTALYELISENLNSSRMLYSVTAPVRYSVARSVSLARLGLLGILLMLVSLVIVLAAAIILDRAQQEGPRGSAH